MIDRWRIVLTNVDGVDSDLESDLSDSITKEIDEIVENDFEVSWG